MERKRGPIHVVPVGATSLLTVFAVLCLTVFALLALSDVRSDTKLADVSLESVGAYYAADTQAQAILAQLRAGQRVDGVEEVKFTGWNDQGRRRRGVAYQYAVPISDAQELQVGVILSGETDGDYEIVWWQTVSTVPWQGEDNIQLWIPD